MDLDTHRLIVRRDGPIGFVVFNHPERRNAMSIDMWQGLAQALKTLSVDPTVRVLVLAGAGDQAFVSGADISEFEDARSNAEADRRYQRHTEAAFDALKSVQKPIIAMIRGYCIGGGMAIALACDLRVCAAGSRFAIPAARLGLGYSFEGVLGLTHVVGQAFAKEILFTGRQLDADEALRIGLVNRVTPPAELDGTVRALANNIASNAPLSVRASKLAVDAVYADPATRDLGRLEEEVRACFDSADYAEGRLAFREKRNPRFEGR